MGKNPLEDEFYNSIIYKNLGDVGQKVAQGVGKAVEEVGKAIGSSVKQGGYNSVNPPPVNPPNQKSNNPPPQGNQSYNPPPANGSYRYVPPKQNNTWQQPKPQWQQQNQQQRANYAPPRTNQKVQSAPRPVPPPKAPKLKTYKGVRFFLTFSAIILALSFLPAALGFIFKILATVGIAIGSYYLFKALIKERPKKEKAKPRPVQAAPMPKAEEKPPENKKRSNTGNPELDKIIDEGNDYIEKLKKANDAIPQEEISNSIERMEHACKGIFEYVADRPAKIPQIKKFLNYYLPTTLKLLDSYEKLSRQTVKGENISSTMFDIEGMMGTIATAFEKQLDGLFGDEAMDIQADITVFESILQQEGLKDAEEELKL